MAFDVEGALAAGYSRTDIADYLAQQKGFDIQGARKAGYDDSDILTHLSSKGVTPKEEKKPEAKAGPKQDTVPNPLKPNEPSFLDRIVDSVKQITTPTPSSVMEGVTTTKEQEQKSIDQRLSLGQGPISEGAVSKAQDIRAGRLKTSDEGLIRVAQALEKQNAPTVESVAQRVTEDERITADAESARRRAVARENPLLGSLQSGLAGMASGGLNLPSVAADAFNQTFVNPVLEAAGLQPLGRTPTAYGTEYLGKAAEDYMPAEGRQGMAEAYDKGQFGQWLFSNMAANSPQIAMSLAAAYFPPLRASILPAMGGTAAGQSFAGGDDSRVALAKGAVEVVTEMLPLGVFDKVGGLFKGMSPVKQKAVLAVAGQRLAQSGAQITADVLTNAIEEAAAEFGGNVLDKYFQGKDVELTQGLADAAVLGGATGGAITLPRAASTLAGRNAPLTPEQEIANTINANVQNVQPAGVNEAAVRALNPQTYDQSIVTPEQTVNRIQQATSVDEVIALAEQAAGTVNVNPAAVPIVPPVETVAEMQQPITDLDQIESTLAPVTEPAAVTLPEPDVAVEQQFGLDKLRLAPRPQRIQGQAVADLTDDALRTVVEDDTVPAITRRGAQIELDARRTEQGTASVEPTLEPTTSPAALAGAPLPAAAAGTVVEPTEPATVREDAQGYFDQQAIAENRPSPVQLNPAPAAEQQAVQDVAQALGSQFGTTIEAYSDPRDVAVNGFAYKGTAFVNTANVPSNITKTSLHEFKHTVEQIAKAETEMGLTGTRAQEFVADIDSIFDDMSDDGKIAYLVNFLAKDELAGLTGRARDKRLRQLMASPTLRSEMTADFLGNRATDKAFWKDVAAQDPQGFKDFVEKWLKIIDNLLATLRGNKNQGQKESAKVDKYVRDLNVAKMVARDALIAYRQGGLQEAQSVAPEGKAAPSLREGERRETDIPVRGEGVQPTAERAGPSASEAGRGEIPEYGTANEGAVSVIGRHYSPRVQTRLSGKYYGTGLRGAEGSRLRESKDSRISDRIYFYVDTGSGIRPESGVGRFAHEVRLNNIYDPASRLIPPQGSSNAFESAVIDAGFDGYIAPFGRGAAVVLLGPKHGAVPVKPLEPGAAFAKREKAAPARVMFEVAPDPNNAELKTRWDAVPFERKIEISQRVAEKIMPQVFKLAGVRAKMTTQLGGYLDDTSPSFAALVPDTASAQQVMDVARLGGFGLAQDSMMVLDLKEFEGSSPTGLITVVLPENMVDQESVHEIYRALRQVSLENISGHTTVGNEMVLAVPSDSMDDLASKIEGVLNARPENFTLKTDEGHMAFPTKEEYDYGQAGEGSPELFAKRSEARRIREEASAAIEEELAKDESAGGRQIDTGVYRSIADDFGLSQAEYNASALPMMLGKTGNNTFRAPRIGGIPEVVEWLDKRYRDAGMASLDLNKAEDRTTLAKMMAAEAVGAIRSAGTAVEWYDDTIRKTLQIMAVKYSELNTDANARNAFLIATAISSQTMNVEDNLRYASKQYEAFRKTGKFPEVGTGKSAPAMGKNFALANSLLEEMGPDLLRRFLQTEFTKRELESIGFKISGESMDEKMLGSAVFGPKIGFGFYSNLSGNFEPVTMDMWFMRTIGRLTGRLPAFDETLFDKQVANLRSAIAETGDSSKGLFAADFDKALVDEAMKSDDGAIALARAVNSLHNRQFIKERAKFDSKERYKTNLVGAAGTILKSADKPKDSPGGGGERQRLRDVVRQMVALVEAQTGKRVPPAALQALIWYPEQELYKKLGVKLRVTSQDYAGAAKSLLTKEGFDGKRISAAAESGSGSARSMAGGEVAGPAQKVGTKGKSTGPLEGKERQAFIGPRVAERLKEEAEALPLVDVFTGLQKRGLPKTKMEAKVERRDDAARIKYVQDNFLDILSELEDSGKVKINCD